MRKNTFCTAYELEQFMSNGGFSMFDQIWAKYNWKMDKADCFQEYYITAAHAIKEYNPCRVDVKLFTYVWHCVENCARELLRHASAKKRTCELSELDYNELDYLCNKEREWEYPDLKSYADICRDETIREVEERASVDRIYRAIEQADLLPVEREIIFGMIEGLTQTELGRRCGYAQSRISHYKNEAQRKLRICLEVMA